MPRPTTNILILLAGFLVLTQAGATDAKLMGCWLNDRVIQSGSPGFPINRSLKCALYFDQKTFTSACPSQDKPNSFSLISYTYDVVAKGEYIAKVTRIDDRPNAVGSALKFVYQVDESSLFLMTFPQTAKPIPFSLVVRDESVSIRLPVKSKEDCLFKAVENSAKSKGV
jgi:hypothetical protein